MLWEANRNRGSGWRVCALAGQCSHYSTPICPTTHLGSLCSALPAAFSCRPQVFATPKRHPRSKPFFDHVLSFSVADGLIWLRNYQVRLQQRRAECAALGQQRAACSGCGCLM